MSITALQGTSFTATVQNAAVGLVGILNVRIENPAGAIVTPATTSGITSVGIGVYNATLTAPSNPGTYVVVWNEGAAVPEASDLLFVTASPAGSYVHSFIGVTPPGRFDGSPWTRVYVEEAVVLSGPFTVLGNYAIPIDTTPADGDPVNISVTTASLQSGYYRFRFTDAAGNFSPYTAPVASPSTTSGAVADVITDGLDSLVSLADVKDYLNLQASDTTHDAKLTRFIKAARPLIEKITGPIIPVVRDEWHEGGQPSIRVRRRPSTGYGTTPILDLIGVDEYVGSTKYSLSVIGEPSQGTTYSCMLDTFGNVNRTSPGGGMTPFAGRVHVVYRAGQRTVPWNVYEGCLELVRVNYQTTQQTGRGRLTVSDTDDMNPHMGFFIPRRVEELLGPTKRHPAVA